MKKTYNIKEIYERIKSNYNQYDIKLLSDLLIINLLHAKIEINCEEVKIYVNGKLYDSFNCDEVENIDDVYELIEAFLLQVEQEGMENGNETYINANLKANIWTRYSLIILSIISIVFALGFITTENLIFAIAFLVCTFISVLTTKYVRNKAYRKYWVCPKCEKSLPLEKENKFSEMKYVSKCPYCHSALEKAPEFESLPIEDDELEIEELKPIYDIPKAGKRWPCFVITCLSTIFSLIFLPMFIWPDEPIEFSAIIIAVALIFIMMILSLSSVFLSKKEIEQHKIPVVVMRESKLVMYVGLVMWVIGFVVTFMDIATLSVPPFDVGLTIVLTFTAILLMILGVWMLLAYRNTAMYVFTDNSITYVNFLGQLKNIKDGRECSVLVKMNGAICLLDKNLKKLFQVETNMTGATEFLQWIENKNLNIEVTSNAEKQLNSVGETQATAQWRNEYHTPLHEHIKEIKILMWCSVIFFLIANITILPLFLIARVKVGIVMAIAAIAPFPLMLFCIIFAPVLIFWERPKNATAEWNSMNIKIPTGFILLIGIIYIGQYEYFWRRWTLQETDSVLFWFFKLSVIISVFTIIMVLRAPKRMKTEAGIFMGIMSLIFSMGINYYVNTALCGPAYHYTAVIVDSHEKRTDIKDDDYKLTVLLDNNKETDLFVFEEVYEMAINGEPLEICQRKSKLGEIMVSIHKPSEK